MDFHYSRGPPSILKQFGKFKCLKLGIYIYIHQKFSSTMTYFHSIHYRSIHRLSQSQKKKKIHQDQDHQIAESSEQKSLTSQNILVFKTLASWSQDLSLAAAAMYSYVKSNYRKVYVIWQHNAAHI